MDNDHPVQSKKIWWWGIVFFVVCLLLYAAYKAYLYWVPAVTIADRYTYTHDDIHKQYVVEGWIGEVYGDPEEITHQDIVYNFTVAALQKEWLRQNNITLNRSNAIQSVEKSVRLKGLLKKIKGYLGNKYYALFVEPMEIDRIYKNVYRQSEQGRNLANGLHQLARSKGLEATSKERAINIEEFKIPPSGRFTQLADELKDMLKKKKRGKAAIYHRLVEVDQIYLVMRPKRVEKDAIIVEGFGVRKQSYRDFVANTITNFSVQFGLLSLYNKQDLLERNGGIF